MEGLFALVVLTLLTISLIALIRPLPRLGLHTRGKAGGLLFSSLLLTVLFDAIYGEEKKGELVRESKNPKVVAAPETTQIVANKLIIQAEREERAVMLFLNTDLPDWAEVWVTLSRLYYRVGKEDAYSGGYFSEKARIAAWRTPRRISYDDAAWKAERSADQARLSRISSDMAYEIDRIEDHLTASVTLHLNQPDPRFGGFGNPNLFGAIVSKSGKWNVVRAKQRIPAPLAGAPLQQSQIVAYDGLQSGRSYRLLKQTPFSPLSSEEKKDLPLDLALQALSSIVQLPAGQVIHVRSVRKTQMGGREYEVEVEGVRGWILDVPLMQIGVERVE